MSSTNSKNKGTASRLLPIAAAAVLIAASAEPSLAAWVVPADVQTEITGIGTGVSLWVASGIGVAIGAFSTGFGWSALTSIIKGAFKKAFG